MTINNVQDFRDALANGPRTLLGCYPVSFLCSDGALLSYVAARDNARRIEESIEDGSNDGWRVVGCDILWEYSKADGPEYCAHTGEPLEYAYGCCDETEAND